MCGGEGPVRTAEWEMGYGRWKMGLRAGEDVWQLEGEMWQVGQ